MGLYLLTEAGKCHDRAVRVGDWPDRELEQAAEEERQKHRVDRPNEVGQETSKYLAVEFSIPIVSI